MPARFWATDRAAARPLAQDLKHPSWPAPLRRGDYTARFVQSPQDLARAQRLRHRCFVQDAGRMPRAGGVDVDGFDDLCDHVIVENTAGDVVCCFRVMALGSGAEIHMSYSAQYYDLKRLSAYTAPMVELGRFCVSPDAGDGDVVRMAWGMLAAFVDLRAAGMLFGCASFAGTDPGAYGGAFDILAGAHLAPPQWRPDIAAPDVVRFAATAGAVQDRRAAMAQVPSLLKTYLTMGGWVSDHAVIDRDMNTLHVFTGLEIAAIPPARAQALRAIATG